MLYNYSCKLINVVPRRNLSYRKALNWYSGLVKPRRINPPYRHVVQIGDPILRQSAEKIPVEEIPSKETQQLLEQMKRVFKKYNCVGLSAPQIGVPRRVLCLELSKSHSKTFSTEEFTNKEVSLLPFTIVINPEIKVSDYTKIVFAESCESVKGFWADVPRYRSIQLNGYDEKGTPIELKTVGWISRIIQHEMDHLNGKLYTDIMDRKTFSCTCWDVVNANNGRVNLPFGPD